VVCWFFLFCFVFFPHHFHSPPHTHTTQLKALVGGANLGLLYDTPVHLPRTSTTLLLTVCRAETGMRSGRYVWRELAAVNRSMVARYGEVHLDGAEDGMHGSDDEDDDDGDDDGGDDDDDDDDSNGGTNSSGRRRRNRQRKRLRGGSSGGGGGGGGGGSRSRGLGVSSSMGAIDAESNEDFEDDDDARCEDWLRTVISYHRNVTTPLPPGVHLGLLLAKSDLNGLEVLVPTHAPSHIPTVAVQSAPLRQSDWHWLQTLRHRQSLNLPPTDSPFKPIWDDAVERYVGLVFGGVLFCLFVATNF
jgi:hypothetical protein